MTIRICTSTFRRLNDYGAASLQALRAATERIERLVQSRDEAGFVELMAAGRRYLEKRT